MCSILGDNRDSKYRTFPKRIVMNCGCFCCAVLHICAFRAYCMSCSAVTRAGPEFFACAACANEKEKKIPKTQTEIHLTLAAAVICHCTTAPDMMSALRSYIDIYLCNAVNEQIVFFIDGNCLVSSSICMLFALLPFAIHSKRGNRNRRTTIRQTSQRITHVAGIPIFSLGFDINRSGCKLTTVIDGQSPAMGYPISIHGSSRINPILRVEMRLPVWRGLV